MIKLNYELEWDSSRPKIITPTYPDLVFLIDTGADMPVWCNGKEEFLDVFPDARLVKYKFLLSGFGTGLEVAEAFTLPEFRLSDGISEIIYQNMTIAITNRPAINVSLILSASMFRHMDVDIKRRESVMHPILSISSDKAVVPMFYRKKTLSDRQRALLGLSEDSIIVDIYAEESRFDGGSSSL